jgi:hypothetical protein
VTPTGWQALSASVRGAIHVRKGRPNQDAVATIESGGVQIAAVADGHGGDRYVRSDTGSQLGVSIACAVVVDQLASGTPLADLASAVPPVLVARWREAVLADVAAHPFTEEETERAGSSLDADPTIAYGATLLLVAAADEIAVLQLGDGDVCVGTADGGVLTPVPTDDRLVASQTTSLCLPTAVDDFRSALLVPEQRVDLVLMSTDGYGNSFADAGWHATVVADLRRIISDDGVERVEAQLARWLEESAEAAGDDTTVALLSRSTPGPAAAAAASPVTAPTATADPRATPKAAAPLWMVVLAAGLGVLAIAGFLFLRGSDGGSPSPTTTTSSATGSSSTTRDLGSMGPTTSQVQVPGAATPVPIRIHGEGVDVTFIPLPTGADPHAVREQSTLSQKVVTSLTFGGATWQIEDARLRRKPLGGAGTTVKLPSEFVPISLATGGDHLWVLNDKATKLAAIDPETSKVVGSYRVDDDGTTNTTTTGSVQGGAS